jgi:hypothetical protein
MINKSSFLKVADVRFPAPLWSRPPRVLIPVKYTRFSKPPLTRKAVQAANLQMGRFANK